MVITDDPNLIVSQAASLQKKGVKITSLPTHYDVKFLLPFFLLNDHSILVVRNPAKELAPILKEIILFGKFNNQTLNLTIWVLIDLAIWLDKLVKKNER